MNSDPGPVPFGATVSLPDTLGETQFLLMLKGRDPPVELKQTAGVFSRFATAAEAGMFAGDRVPPTRSLLQVLSHEREADRIRYRCKIRGVDTGAFRILLNVLSESCRRLEPLNELQLAGAAPTARDAGLEAVLAHAYPGRATKVPFNLHLREFFFENREPVIRIEFQQKLGDQQFDQIKNMIEAWDHILALGGYVTSTREADFFPEPGELYLAEPAALEHLVYAFEGPEETYNAIINMAVKIHSTICPVDSLEID